MNEPGWGESDVVESNDSVEVSRSGSGTLQDKRGQFVSTNSKKARVSGEVQSETDDRAKKGSEFTII